MNNKNLVKSKTSRKFSLSENEGAYNFILINNEGHISNIKAYIPSELNYIKELTRKENNIKYEQFNLNKKEIERNTKLIDGIIFIYKEHKIEILKNIIDYFYKFDKNNKKGKSVPKIILGKKNEISNFLNDSKTKQKILKKIKYLKFLEIDINEKNEINLALEEFIKFRKLYQKYEKFIIENKINEKQLINNLGKSKMNISKCSNCNQIFQISINHYSNVIYLYCEKCKLEKKININDYENFKNTTSCHICNKEINITTSNNYCFKCQENICNDCIKNHIQKDQDDNQKSIPVIYQSNLVDIFCNIHNKLFYNYCLDCKMNICIECELEYHLDHNTNIYNDKNINDIISIQKKYLSLERQKSKRMKEFIEDCLKELKKYLDNLIVNKEKRLNVIEDIIKECEVYRYDKILLENIKNLKLENSKTIIFNNKNNCIQKLNDILEFFNEPIKLEKTKLCLEENLKGPFNTLKQLQINNKSIEQKEKIENITDLCPLFNNYMNKNYFAVSYNNGLLKIYNDDFENRIPFKIIKEFGEREGINSLYKSGKKSLILVGYSKIKKIRFYDNLNEYKVINEFNFENQLFKTLIEFESFDIFVATNNLNQLLCINSKTGNIIEDITKNVDKKEKEILYIDKINDNKIIIKFYESKSIKLDLVRESILNSIDNDDTIIIDENNNSLDDTVNDTIISNYEIYNPKESVDTFWKILEINLGDNNNIEIKKNFLFDNKINYLGNLDEQLLLLFNKKSNILIIFDSINYYNIIEMDFNSFYKPIISFTLNKRNNILDLLFLCEKGILNQYSLNLVIGLIYPIGRTKINQINDKDNNLFHLYSDDNKVNNNETKNCIVKIINLNENNFILMTDDNSIYNLKNK